jgi:hypothetical protein
MKECKYFQQLIIEDFYNEIETQEKSKLTDHLKSCDNCKTRSLQIQSTLQNMNRYERPEPPVEFWNNYWLNLESKLEQKISVKQKLNKLFSGFHINPSWIYGIASAAAFLIIGIFIGRIYFTPSIHDSVITNDVSQKNIRTVANAERYLQRSKVLLLGIVNMDIDVKSEYKPSISKQQEISRELIQQTAVLKEDLKEANQKMLLELVNDLETILLQIANLEKEYDFDAIELIQSSLDRKGILIKINLGEILSLPSSVKTESNQKNKKQL